VNTEVPKSVQMQFDECQSIRKLHSTTATKSNQRVSTNQTTVAEITSSNVIQTSVPALTPTPQISSHVLSNHMVILSSSFSFKTSNVKAIFKSEQPSTLYDSDNLIRSTVVDTRLVSNSLMVISAVKIQSPIVQVWIKIIRSWNSV